MKTVLQKTLSILLVIISCTFTFGQRKAIKSTTDDYRDYAYVRTSEVLLEVAEKGYRSQKLLQRLANSFYFNNEMKQAARWYGELFSQTDAGKIDPEYYFRYALALKGAGLYEDSDEWMKKFNKLKSNDLRAKAYLSNTDYRSIIASKANEDIKLINLDINTKYSDFGSTELGNDLVFASSRSKSEDDDIYAWNNQPYLDIFIADKDVSGEYFSPRRFDSKINTKYHESIASYTNDGTTMYFTRNNYFKKRKGKDKKGVTRLQLFRATKDTINGVWTDVTSVHFNSANYSVAHPSINKEGTRLYFASDMEGTLGQSDIYVVDIKENGTLGIPKNLGEAINTEGQESFPFINANGDLYYASNGLPGLGGKDIFVAKGLDSKMFGDTSVKYKTENLGAPINSAHDDFAYYENLISKQAFLSSNRPGGKGDDDIYTFTIPECSQRLKGIVTDAKTKAIIPGATVLVLDKEGKEIERTTVGDDAAFNFKLDCKQEYIIRGDKATYVGDEKRINTTGERQKLELNLDLIKDKNEITTCGDLAKILDIPLVYFDFDKYNIRYDAEIELNKILAVLNKYPSMTIEIRSHTDSRGSVGYNKRLSTNRAKSSRQYLISQGVDSWRIIANGYGESKLLNRCNDGSKCSESEHQENRRSEFIITSLKGKNCTEQ